MDDTIGGLDISLLDLLAVDSDSALERDAEGFAVDGGGLHSLGEVSGHDLARDHVVLEDVSKVGEGHELNLRDLEGTSGICKGVVVGGEESEGALSHEHLVEASLCRWQKE